MVRHRPREGELIGRVVATDRDAASARVRLALPLDAGESVGTRRGAPEPFVAHVQRGEVPVARGEAGQEVTLADVPPDLEEGDVLVRRTPTLGSVLRDALGHARQGSLGR